MRAAMRAAKMSAGTASGRWHPDLEPGATPYNRARPGSGRAREPAAKRAKRAGPRLPGLLWVPVPLAVLVTVLGWLVIGSLLGQHAAANDQHAHGYQAGGLALDVQAMGWMSNDMGDGPVQVPQGYSMPSSMMPGMQKTGDNRLHLEFSLSNTTSSVQRYSMSEFRVVAPGGQSWKLSSTGGIGHAVPIETVLQPGFRTIVDAYFDIPAKQSKNLTVEWSRDGTTVDIPVSTNGTLPSQHIH
jgi:hypothetical protein